MIFQLRSLVRNILCDPRGPFIDYLAQLCRWLRGTDHHGKPSEKVSDRAYVLLPIQTFVLNSRIFSTQPLNTPGAWNFPFCEILDHKTMEIRSSELGRLEARAPTHNSPAVRRNSSLSNPIMTNSLGNALFIHTRILRFSRQIHTWRNQKG